MSARHLRNTVGHRDVGPCSAGLPAEQPWLHSIHRGLQHLAEAGHGWGGDQLPWPEAAPEGRRGDAVRRAALPRFQRHEPLQFAYLLQVQELFGGLLPQVSRAEALLCSVLPLCDWTAHRAATLVVPG